MASLPAELPNSLSTGRNRATLLALLVVSILKMAWAMTSAGSVDAVLFFNFAEGIDKAGLCALYPAEARFNHTPLTGYFTWLLYRAGNGEFLNFSCLLRLTCIFADMAVVGALLHWREKLCPRLPWWALLLFAASPISLMVSGFHGNVDPIMVAVLFFAAVAAVFERPVLCGLLFGLACNIKIVPLPLAPVFFFFWLARGKGWRFAVTAGAIILAGSALPLIVCPGAYLHNVFGYGSVWGVWGFTYLLHQTEWSSMQTIGYLDLSPAQLQVASALKLITVAGMLAVAWKRRRVAPIDLPASLAMAWVVFFVFAPGIGVQYMVWFAPFLLLLTVRGYVLVTAMSTIFLFAFYHSTSQGRFPWFLAMPHGPDAPFWSAWGTLTWLTFVGLLIAGIRGRRLSAGKDEMPSASLPDAGGLPVAS